MSFEIIGEIENSETFAVGRSIRELPRLLKIYGKGRWRKRKGFATVLLPGGEERRAEIHWYEASGIGRKEFINPALKWVCRVNNTRPERPGRAAERFADMRRKSRATNTIGISLPD